MILWAIVPFKSLRQGKSRLNGALTAEERATLSRELLTRTLELLLAAEPVRQTVLVSRDEEALALARRLGAGAVEEMLPRDLNRALAQATRYVAAQGASAVLILPADLPLLSEAEIQAVCACANKPPAVVLSPDRRQDGTNALLVSPPGLIEYSFGTASYGRHLERARQAGARLAVCDLPGLALDIDLPEDLDLLPAGRSASWPPSPRSSA